MKAKAIFLASVALFSFCLGIVFEGKLSSGKKREIASEKTEANRSPDSKLDTRVSDALKNCLAEKAGPGRLDVSKVVVDGRNWAIVSLDCVGNNAKALYDAVAPYSSEQYVRYSDGRRGVARFFGRLYPPSQCVRVIRAAKGGELNLYSCSVRVDLDHELIEGLKL